LSVATTLDPTARRLAQTGQPAARTRTTRQGAG
jgi:hypothetical protein